MIWFNAVLAIHLLGAVAWVGGMAFALLVLRPSLAVLAPEQRMALHMQVFRRFFRLVWHAMPLMLLSGYAMLFGALGGFAGARPAIHVMHLFGLVMAAVFLLLFFGPWRTLRADPSAATAALGRIRRLIWVNLALGVATVVVAAWAA